VLILHRSERADRLVDALGELLAEPLQDPVTPEVVAVPTRGVERWITQRLSHRLGAGPGGGGGVCANLEFPFPGSLVARATAMATGIDPDADPWAAERLVWPLIELIDRHAEDPVLAPLMQHLAASTPRPGPGSADPVAGRPPPVRLRRFATARHVADLFDRYAVHRPDMVRAWAEGLDEGAVGEGTPWQPHLWRLARQRVGTPSPAERLTDAEVRMRADRAVLDLPDRISVFGLTRLPAGHLAVLGAIAAHRDVHLFLLHPSGELWNRTADMTAPMAAPARSEDPTARLARHPLLRSWGRDAREMQLVISASGADGGRHYPVVDSPATTLLARLQADIRADRQPGGDRASLDRRDRSLQVHACHGRSRQVEVLRDSLLHLLEEDPTLEARNVIVMCPDIETYAPLIQAAFGVDATLAAPAGDGPVLRVRLADRSLRQTNPLLGVAAGLLDLAGSRVSAPEVADLAARPPVSRRFRFDQEDLATIERWIAGTAVRWGLDAEHRRSWALGGLAANTWAAGLDRLMLGVAMAEADSRVFQDTVPFEAVSGSEVDLAGRFAEMVHRLASAVANLSGPLPLGAWVESLIAATEAMACSAADEAWQHAEMRAALIDAARQASGFGPSGAELTLDEVRYLLADQLRGRPTRANFRTGDLTICTLVPMRSVPHRVVALLGLDDGAFPRHPEVDGDDLLLAAPRVGDRDARSEDRQLLLDALLAASDNLLITYCGRDERTNRRRPPCAPVAELLDVVDATVRTADGDPARDSVVVHHPLQPFDPRNFRPGELAVGGPWSFDPVFLAGARSSRAPVPAEDRAVARLPDLAETVIQLDHLVTFVQHPVRAFLRRRLSLYLGDWSEELDDRMPLELDPLDRWALGDRLLEAILAGADPERSITAELRRGLLPPGALSGQILRDVGSGVVGLVSAMVQRGYGPAPSDAAEIRVALPDGRSIVGTVPQVRDGTILQCTYSRLGPKHRLAAWVRFLAMSADRPELAVSALTVGKATRSGAVSVSTLAALPEPADRRRARACARLADIVDLYDRGMRGPLPMACNASAKWAEGRRDGLDDDGLLGKASGTWASSSDIPGERDQPEHVFVFGRDSDFRDLLAEPPGVDESGAGWEDGEPHRFGRLARRLWEPLLSHERTADE
jgi:exodeoxyribonuclease V gamma subunit